MSAAPRCVLLYFKNASCSHIHDNRWLEKHLSNLFAENSLESKRNVSLLQEQYCEQVVIMAAMAIKLTFRFTTGTGRFTVQSATFINMLKNLCKCYPRTNRTKSSQQIPIQFSIIDLTSYSSACVDKLQWPINYFSSFLAQLVYVKWCQKSP